MQAFPRLAQRVPPAPRLAKRTKDHIGAAGFDLKDHFQEFPEPAFGEPLLFEPSQILWRQVCDGHTLGRKFFGPEFSKGHFALPDLFKQVAKVLTIDLGEIHPAILAEDPSMSRRSSWGENS